MFTLLLILIFTRPFISSLAFPYLNLTHSFLLLIFLFIWLIPKGIPIKKIQSLKYPLSLFFLALIISVIFSTDKLNSLKELYKYIIGFSLFLTTASLANEDKMRLIRAVILAGFFISLLAIYQYFFGFRHILEYLANNKIASSFTLDYIQRKRAFFPFISPNTLAGYLIMIIPLAITQKNRIWFIIPLSFGLLLTKSLGGFLTLFFGLIIYCYLQGKLEKRKTLFICGVLIITGLVFMSRAASQEQYLQPVFSTLMRLSYWKDTLAIIKIKPLTGVGIGNFNLAQSRYAHNSYLQIWAEMGILGIISIFWLVIWVLKSNLITLKDSPYKIKIASLITANIVFLIHNLVDFTFFLPEVTVIWWSILGVNTYLSKDKP